MVNLPFWIPRSRVRKVVSLDVTIYRKPTHTDQYLHFDSHHPVSHKLSVIRTLNYRAQTAVTDPVERTKELDLIKGALSRCGYRQ